MGKHTLELTIITRLLDMLIECVQPAFQRLHLVCQLADIVSHTADLSLQPRHVGDVVLLDKNKSLRRRFQTFDFLITGISIIMQSGASSA